MILSDTSIEKRLTSGALVVKPLFLGAIQPASIDLRLGDVLKAWPTWIMRDPRVDQSGLWRTVDLAPIRDLEGEPVDEPCWILHPGVRYLIATREYIKIPSDMAGVICARSSWGRDGLAVICGPAGLVDPGYEGCPSLELSAVGSELVIWPGAVVAQMVLHYADEPAVRPYGHPDRQSKYQGDEAAQPSRTHLEARSC